MSLILSQSPPFLFYLSFLTPLSFCTINPSISLILASIQSVPIIYFLYSLLEKWQKSRCLQPYTSRSLINTTFFFSATLVNTYSNINFLSWIRYLTLYSSWSCGMLVIFVACSGHCVILFIFLSL